MQRTAPMRMVDPKLGQVVAGRYRLVDILGQGGMATVYCAVDRDACRPVAVKLIKEEGLAHSIVHTRFHREARAIASLNHDGFARLYDWGIERGAPFMVMEMVRGESLAAVLKRHRRLSTPVALKLAIAVCELLEVVHARGFLHRDVKPSNVMVQSVNDARVKLIDFGISTTLATPESDASMAVTNAMALTTVGTLLGSPPYTSPEQLRGEPLDQRADLYAMGVMLFRMVTGHKPFAARHQLATACMQLSHAPPAPSLAFPLIDRELENVILRCMSPRSADRFGTATDLRGALVAILARLQGNPEPVPQPPMRPRFSDRMLVAATALAAVATTAWLVS